MAWGTVPQGWALTRQKQWAAGMARLREGSEAALAARSEQWRPYYLALRAEAAGAAVRPEDGRRLLAEAQEVMARTDERFYEAELLRLGGRLLEIDGDDTGAQARYREAIATAEERGAKLFALRAGRDLAGFWQRRGQGTEARQMLQPLYGWFTEGFEFSDLREAKALLDSLQKGPAKPGR